MLTLYLGVIPGRIAFICAPFADGGVPVIAAHAYYNRAGKLSYHAYCRPDKPEHISGEGAFDVLYNQKWQRVGDTLVPQNVRAIAAPFLKMHAAIIHTKLPMGDVMWSEATVPANIDDQAFMEIIKLEQALAINSRKFMIGIGSLLLVLSTFLWFTL